VSINQSNQIKSNFKAPLKVKQTSQRRFLRLGLRRKSSLKTRLEPWNKSCHCVSRMKPGSKGDGDDRYQRILNIHRLLLGVTLIGLWPVHRYHGNTLVLGYGYSRMSSAQFWKLRADWDTSSLKQPVPCVEQCWRDVWSFLRTPVINRAAAWK